MPLNGTPLTRASLSRLSRRVVTLLGAIALIAATAVAGASSAAADDTPTFLDGVSGVGDVAAGAGKVFVAALDRIVVADSTGAVTGAVSGVSGAVGLALSADNSRLYAALSGSNEVAEIDTGTLQIKRRISTDQYPCPAHLSLAGNRLWVGYGCDQWGGGVVTLDVSEATPTVTAATGGYYGAPVVSATANVLVVGSLGLSPAYFDVYSLDGASATLRGSTGGDASNLGDLVLTPDGATVIVASGYPYNHIAYDTTTLTEVRRYGDPNNFWGYPNAVAISPDGTFLAAGRNGSPEVSVHRVDSAALVNTADNSVGDLVPRALTFLGSDLFGVLNDWQSGRFYLWRVSGATLPSSAISLTPPTSARALEPLTITGQLTLSDNTAPGAQQLTVTRTLPDDTKATLAPVTTAADGTFSITDSPPVAGSIRYDVTWAGNAGYRGSSASVTVQVDKRTPTLTLTGPTTGEAGKRLRLSGSLTLDGRAPSPAATLSVFRTIYNNRLGGVTDQLANVVTDSRGGFRFDDTPTQGGRYIYTVRWAGSATYNEASADHEVSVTSTASQITGIVEQPAYVGEPFRVAGGISFDVGECVGPTIIHITRQIGSGPVEQRPDLSTDPVCSFHFQDTLTLPATVYYTFTWDGDASHRGATATVSGIVQKQPSYIQATADDYYLRSGQRPLISGRVAGSRTGIIGTALTLIVTRTGPDGSTVRLRDVTTATDGTFSFRDSLPKVDASTFPAFTYTISWSGSATYEGSSTTVTVYVTPTG